MPPLPQHRKEPIDRGKTPRPVDAPAVGADQQVFLNRKRGKEPPAFRYQSDTELDDFECRQRADIVASSFTAAAGRGSRPAIAFRKVDFPAPLAPMMAT